MNDLLRALIQDVVNSTYSMGGVSITVVDKLADYLVANPPEPKDPIIVILSEGEVKDVQIPCEGCTVEVHDYTDGNAYMSPKDLKDYPEIDEDYYRYRILTWST